MGRPEKPGGAIAGDGCFRMNMNEIVPAVPGNHLCRRSEQIMFWEMVPVADFTYDQDGRIPYNDAKGWDFCEDSRHKGAKAIRVTKMEEVEFALKEALVF